MVSFLFLFYTFLVKYAIGRFVVAKVEGQSCLNERNCSSCLKASAECTWCADQVSLLSVQVGTCYTVLACLYLGVACNSQPL